MNACWPYHSAEPPPAVHSFPSGNCRNHFVHWNGCGCKRHYLCKGEGRNRVRKECANWSDENSRVVHEYENPDERDTELVAYTPENWEDYGVVFVGYPIWWYDAAWPVEGFVEGNDFTGKTVIPFCTSSSSDIGESGRRLAGLAGTGDWQEGQRFRSGAPESDIRAWVDSLNL